MVGYIGAYIEVTLYGVYMRAIYGWGRCVYTVCMCADIGVGVHLDVDESKKVLAHFRLCIGSGPPLALQTFHRPSGIRTLAHFRRWTLRFKPTAMLECL